MLSNYPFGIFAGKRVGSINSILFCREQGYLLQWVKLFLEAMLHIMEQGRIVGKDQDIMSNIAINHNDIVRIRDGEARSCHGRSSCMMDLLAELSNRLKSFP